jgi:hypothetical protein
MLLTAGGTDEYFLLLSQGAISRLNLLEPHVTATRAARHGWRVNHEAHSTSPVRMRKKSGNHP